MQIQALCWKIFSCQRPSVRSSPSLECKGCSRIVPCVAESSVVSVVVATEVFPRLTDAGRSCRPLGQALI
jgi:hypothetical protein